MNTKKLIANRYPLSAKLSANRYPLNTNLTAIRYPLTAKLSANRYSLTANLKVDKKGYLKYTYGRGKKHSVTLYGRWIEISDTRLIYKIKGSKDKLEFKVQLQPRQRSEHNRLAYNITAGRKKSKRVTTLYFSGQWLITKKGDKAKFKLSIPNTRKKTITFGIDKVLKEGKTLSAVLSTSGSRRRIRLTLRKKDWSFFVEGSKSKRSKAVKAGIKIRF